MRSSGASPSPAAIARSGRPAGSALALDQHLARLRGIDAVDQPQEFRAPGPDQPAEAEHLAGADLERDAADLGSRRRPRTSSSTRSVPAGAVGVEALDLAADHELDQLVGGGGRRDPGGGGAPVGEHRDPVADPPDLVEPVRDVDDADALGGEPADDLEQGLDLALVEDRGGLVHDQQAHVVGERARDRDHLLGGGPQGADPRARVDPAVAEALQQRRRLGPHPLQVEQGPRRGSWARKMLWATRQLLDQVELLVDRRDAAVEAWPRDHPRAAPRRRPRSRPRSARRRPRRT